MNTYGLDNAIDALTSALKEHQGDIRTTAAIAIAQGLVAYHGCSADSRELAKASVRYADALIEELCVPELQEEE